MRRLATALIVVGVMAAGLAEGSAAAGSPPLARQAPATLHVSRDLLVRTPAFPTEGCCRWIAKRAHHGFRGGTADPCATDHRVLPRSPYGVVTRRYEYWGRTDRIHLDDARSTLVRLLGGADARAYKHRLVRGFDCPPRTVDGSGPGSATATYDVVRRSAHRTVIAEKIHDLGATTMWRYIDIRRVRAYIAIVEFYLGEDIDYTPHLRRVDKIADAQQRRLRDSLAS